MVNPVVRLQKELEEILLAGGIENAAMEARWIAEDITDAEQARSIARKRAEHYPLQYLLGAWEFYGMRFLVGEGVLIPRADTETLVDTVLQCRRAYSGGTIVDLCTGSGCIALALQQQLTDTKICGIDLSPKALEYARKNAEFHHLPVEFYNANVLDPTTAAQFSDLDGIVSNPPYLTADDMHTLQTEVTHEPSMALAGGEDGLRFYREITALWKHTLKPGGLLAFEVGMGQAEAVRAILAKNAFENIAVVPDLCGIDRVVYGYNYGRYRNEETE